MRINGVILYAIFALLLCAITAGGFLLISKRANLNSGFALAIFPSSEKIPLVLTSEELADLVKPSVVRIAAHFSGEAEIAPFDINLTKATFSFPQGKSLKVPIDQTVLGSGFVINSDGYILTNAHVVSDESIKSVIAADIILKMIYLRAQGLTKAEAEAIVSAGSSAYEKFGKDLLKQLIAKSTFTIKKEITVLNPSSKKSNLKDFILDGFSATIVKVNDDFIFDNKDAGLIKIDQHNLPSVRLAGDENLAVGDKINIFGFPASADFNKEGLLEPTLTQGVVSALKDSYNKDFKIFQTDAKISPGSSGGPLFNAKGEVAGIVAYQSDPSQLAQDGGDNFAFAIPIKIAKRIINGAVEISLADGYAAHFTAGLELLQSHSCKAALAQFDEALKTNSSFNVDKYVSPYVQECANLIASGQSIDTWWDAFLANLKNINATAWLFVGGGVFALAVLVFLIIFLMKRMRKEEKEIVELESKVGGEIKTNVGAFIPRSAQPSPAKLFESGALPAFVGMNQETEKIFKGEWIAKPVDAKTEVKTEKIETKLELPKTDPSLVKYVKDARMAHMTDAAIKEELKKVGWLDEQIAAAISAQ